MSPNLPPRHGGYQPRHEPSRPAITTPPKAPSGAGAGSPVERAVVVVVLRCPCSKIHTAAGIGQTTECTCGQRLWPLLWNGDQA